MPIHSSRPHPEDAPDSSLDSSPAAPPAADPAAARASPAVKPPRRHGFSSAKYDRPHADTLDRRKAEKPPLPDSDPPAIGGPHNSARRGRTVEPKAPDSGVPAERDRSGNKGDAREWRRTYVPSPWRSSLLVLATTALATALLAAIVRSFFTRHVDPKGCKMCGMWPAYAKLDGFDTEHTRFASKYSLYLYREATVNADTTVRGVPVLFIPGNAGSYRQVRSIAAAAAHYFAENLQHDEAAHARGMRDLDFFTADFNEDITAFHGQTLLDQAEYLNEAVAYILALYHDPQRPRRAPGEPDPTAVLVVGHSMGGLVARAMLQMPNYQAHSINTIITMSTPHARPPVSFDADIVRVYRDVDAFWRRSHSQTSAADNPLDAVALVSIAGGGLDATVPSDSADLASLVPASHGFTVFTSSVPRVWTGADHLSILWCDQLRTVIARALLDVVDVRQATQTKPRAERMRILRKWLLTGLEADADRALARTAPTALLTLEDAANSILREGERLTLRSLGAADGAPHTYLLPVPQLRAADAPAFHLLSDQPLDAPGDDAALAVLFCSAFPPAPGHSAALFAMHGARAGTGAGGAATRLACKRAPSDVVPLPASTPASRHAFDDTRPFAYLRYDLAALADEQYVAVVDRSAAPRPGWLLAEFAAPSATHRVARQGLPGILWRGFHFTFPAARPLAVEINIPAVHSSLLAYQLQLSPQRCGDRAPLFAPLLRQHVAHPFESRYVVNASAADVHLHARAPYMPPPLFPSTEPQGLSLQLWADPTCATPIDLSLKVDVMGSLGALVMRYRTAVPAAPLVVVALVLRKQFMRHDRAGAFVPFGTALDACLRASLPTLLLALTVLALSLASPNSPLPGGAAVAGGATGPPSGNATAGAALPTGNDLLLGTPEPLFALLVPAFGGLGVAVAAWVHYAALLLVHGLAALHRLLGLLRARLPRLFRAGGETSAAARPSPLPPVTPASLRRRLTIAVVLFGLVATVIPYQFAYLVACLVQLSTCVRAVLAARDHPHYPAASPTPSAPSTSSTSSGAASPIDFSNYAHSVLVLMLCVLPVNLPVFVVWAHNLAVHWLTPFASHHNVLSVAPFIVLVETLTAGTMIPRLASRARHVTNLLFFVLAVYAALYGVSFAYRLHHLANLICAWLVLVHWSASGWSGARLLRVLGGGNNNVGGPDEGRLKKRP